MRTVLYIMGKDLLLQFRDRMGFFWWMLGFPLLVSVLIGTIFSGVLEGPGQAPKIAIVDQAQSEASREFVTMLTESGSVRIQHLPVEAARKAVRKGEVVAFIVLREPFRISPAVFWGKRLPIEVGVDPVRQGEWAFLQAVLNQNAMDFLRREWTDPQRRPRMIENWLADLGRGASLNTLEGRTFAAALTSVDRFLNGGGATTRPAAQTAEGLDRLRQMSMVDVVPIDEPGITPASAFEICFPLGIMWGIIGIAAEFAQAFVKERQLGTAMRLRIAPITRGQILMGNGLACFVSCIGVMLLLLAVGHLVFGVRLQNAGVLAVAILAISFCFVGITMFLSVIGKTESAVGGASWAVLLIFSMLGGGMVPQIFMPEWMDPLGQITPVKWAILGLEGGIWRGFSLADMAKPCLILISQGLVLGALGVVILYRTDR